MKKKVVTLMLGVMLGCSFMGSNCTIVSYAAAANNGDASILATDVIEYKFRIINGKHQYRRWNATKGKWVDPYWITI